MTKSNYLGLVLVAISLLLVTEINCQCYDIIDQYYSCKNLKMVHTTCSFYDTAVPYSSDNNNTGSNCIYEPDSSIPNNKLTDSFYRRKKLDKMSFNEAMNLFKKIYDEIDGCDTEFCECVQKRSFYPVPYDIYFRDDDTFKDVKKIIKAYNEKYQSRMLPYEEIKYNFPQGGSKILQKFCAKYDFTNIRLYTYKDVTKCFKDYDPNTFYDCEYEVKVVNKSLQLNYTNDQQIKRLKCFLLGKTKCPKELQRFYLLSIWSGEAPNVTFTQRSLISFFDSIIKEAKHYKPKITFGTISLSSYGNITSLISYSNGWSMYNGTESKFNKTCFSSNQLKIDCFWEFSHNESNPMSLMRVDFEFIFDKSLSYNLSVNVPSLLDTSSSSIKNETVKDNQGQNWLQFISSNSSTSLEIYDFNSNINIMLFIYDLYLNAPKDLLKSGSGVFVNGFTNN